MNTLIAITITIITLLLYILYNSINYDHCKGVWVASKEFCDDAEIDEMIILIGDNVSKSMFSQTRGGYILTKVDNIPVENKYIDIDLTPHISFGNIRSFSITLSEIETMPDNMEMKLNIIDNTMIMTKNKEIYADLIKDNESSLLVNSNISTQDSEQIEQIEEIEEDDE